jgi:hypothetical protein
MIVPEISGTAVIVNVCKNPRHAKAVPTLLNLAYL